MGTGQAAIDSGIGSSMGVSSWGTVLLERGEGSTKLTLPSEVQYQPSQSEKRLADRLRLAGLVFETSYPLRETPYTLDIAFPQVKLCVEIDGPAHDQPGQKQKDKKRDERLKNLGWETVRIDTSLIWNSASLLEAVGFIKQCYLERGGTFQQDYKQSDYDSSQTRGTGLLKWGIIFFIILGFMALLGGGEFVIPLLGLAITVRAIKYFWDAGAGN